MPRRMTAGSTSRSSPPRASREWARTVASTVAGRPERSPFFRITQASKVKIKLDRKVPYEIDGGARTKAKAYRIAVEPGAITVRVPTSTNGDGGGEHEHHPG